MEQPSSVRRTPLDPAVLVRERRQAGDLAQVDPALLAQALTDQQVVLHRQDPGPPHRAREHDAAGAGEGEDHRHDDHRGRSALGGESDHHDAQQPADDEQHDREDADHQPLPTAEAHGDERATLVRQLLAAGSTAPVAPTRRGRHAPRDADRRDERDADGHD
ncbi:hypothetical protein [Curtobacterium citreum]|uniref:Uncharacterized protein n=1 Tax=Curtobacterium citreum TaxID=2036 RepID=A0ABT2HG64_9MICO|nr:hypothetical protein [Curtobacterium citreum]MCS6522251.1 hypothetical protein [Curtobacterium citreum]